AVETAPVDRSAIGACVKRRARRPTSGPQQQERERQLSPGIVHPCRPFALLAHRTAIGRLKYIGGRMSFGASPLQLATPERVRLSLPIAGIGYRSLAYLIDWAALFAFWIVLYF